MKNKATGFAKNPGKVMKEWIKRRLTSERRSCSDSITSPQTFCCGVSKSPVRGMFQVLGKGYVYCKKFDADGAYRLSRGLDFMDGFQKSAKWKAAAKMVTFPRD